MGQYLGSKELVEELQNEDTFIVATAEGIRRITKALLLEIIPSDCIEKGNYLSKNNLEKYTPTLDYHPATKKYVDDSKVTKTSELTNDSGFLVQSDKFSGSWNDLSEKPFLEKTVEVDIIPAQEVTFTDGVADCLDVKDPYDSGVISSYSSGESVEAFLQINGEVLKGELTYNYVVRVSFNGYTFSVNKLTLGENAAVNDGETVTVRMYAFKTEITPLESKYLDKDVAVIPKDAIVLADSELVPLASPGCEGEINKWTAIPIRKAVTNYASYIPDYGINYRTEESVTEYLIDDINITRRFFITNINISNNNYIHMYFNYNSEKYTADSNLILSTGVTDGNTHSITIVGTRLTPYLWRVELYMDDTVNKLQNAFILNINAGNINNIQMEDKNGKSFEPDFTLYTD